MYEKIIIGSLLLGYISILSVSATTSPGATTKVTNSQTTGLSPTEVIATSTPRERLAGITPPTEVSATRKKPDGARRQISHVFSEPVIIIIVLGVIAGIIGFILLVVFFVSLLTKKSSLDIQPTFSNDTSDPLTSVETENPESNQ